MNIDQILDTLETLSKIPGVSGDEGLVRAEIIRLIHDYCEYSVDPAGNIIAYKKGAKRAEKKLMLSAHMDEIGLIVTSIDDSGLLRFSAVGGIDSRILTGKAVELGEKRICGVIGAKAVHQLNDKEKGDAPSPDMLYIDIGANSRDEALSLVNPGDRAVFAPGFARLGEDAVLGRAFDDRAGCALLIALIRWDIECDCVFAFTVQEETGCAGGATAAYTAAPDISVVVEATTASDIPGCAPERVVCEQGKGPVLSFMDRGAVYDGELYELAMKTAADNGIPCQPKLGVFGGNESRSIQTSRGGVRGLAVSLPCRYIHTPRCMLRIIDLKSSFELLERLIPALGGLKS